MMVHWHCVHPVPKVWFAAIVWIAAVLFAGTAKPQEPNPSRDCEPPVHIDSSAGVVTVKIPPKKNIRASREKIIRASNDLLLCPGDEIKTGPTGRVAIRFKENNTVIRLDGDSKLRLLSVRDEKLSVNLISGILYFLSSIRGHLDVETPYIVAGIDGTEALVGVQPGEVDNGVWRNLAIAAVREGLVRVYDRGAGKVFTVRAGEAAFRSEAVESGKVEFKREFIRSVPSRFRELLIDSDSAVNWAVYYPPIMFAQDTTDEVKDAVILLSSGDYAKADEKLAEATSEEKSPSPRTNAAAASLRTIIAVAQNRITEAKRWSRMAMQVDSNFAPAYVAASYERQAAGDLDGALDFARDAAKRAPYDAYVTARLAELQMTVGDRREALETAEKSIAITPTSLALFVAGLARLAAWEYGEAEMLFSNAIRLDPEAPLPRLGLGLAFIRQGKTADGAWEIERAVAHDPRRAALRTWLGRAYFDEGLAEKATEQFRLSTEEDPNDPTPYLFSALEHYAANDPIGALRELQAADERGGARRVIRSERGLGEDTATIGAALGRVYDVLDFDQLAVNEGAKAVETDPSNPGAHRFLADAYRQRPGLGIAQASELLRSQLLSPPSKIPVQPELAEADLALLDTTGPSRVTFAEFAPLFDSDGFRVDASGLYGTQHTWGDQVSVTGLYRGASISVGQFHYETDGFRANNDLSHDIFDSVATFALSPEFTLFGEYRFRKSEGGDRRLDFNINDFNDTFRSDLQRNVGRLGFHARTSVESDLLGVYTWANLLSGDQVASFFPGVLDFREREDDSHSIQLQHIWQYGNIRNVAGGSYIKNNVRDEFSIFGGLITGLDYFSTNYYTIYDYIYIDLPQRVTWTFGGSLVSFKTEGVGPANPSFDVVEFLPKVGVNAEITDKVSLRAVYLRNLKPELVSEQVLEPTGVAGFTQSYDAFNTSLVEQVGVGIDLKLGDQMLVGAEAIHQWWRVPLLNMPQPDTDEQIYRAYAYATLSDEFALSAELIDERSASDLIFDDFTEWRTTTVPVTLSYFSPSGLFGALGVEFVSHHVENFGVSNNDRFALVNASIGFRLPNNAGVLTIEAQNLLDERFNYQNRVRRPDIAAAPRFAPERVIQARGTIKF